MSIIYQQQQQQQQQQQHHNSLSPPQNIHNSIITNSIGNNGNIISNRSNNFISNTHQNQPLMYLRHNTNFINFSPSPNSHIPINNQTYSQSSKISVPHQLSHNVPVPPGQTRIIRYPTPP
jgi:hypothetical protein